jgi:hypothetical protein
MKVKGSRRLVRRLGLALAVVALMVPATAQAMTMNASYESGGSVRLYADDLHASIPPVAVHKQRLYADDLHSVPVSTEPGNFEPINPRARPDLYQPPVTVTEVVADDSGFDWGVAAIGAALGALGMALLAGVLYVERHNRRSRLAAT